MIFLWFFRDEKTLIYLKALFLCLLADSYFPILGGNLYPFASEASTMLYENTWYFWRLDQPFFSTRIPIFVKFILTFRYLRGNLYPFRSEASPSYMKILGIFGVCNTHFYFQNSYFCEVYSYYPIFRG